MEITEKINSLARELLKHGMANSSDEAYRQAEMMLRKGSASEENKEGRVEERLNAISREVGLRLNSLQREINALQADMAGLKKNFEQLNSEISSVKSKLNSIITRMDNIQFSEERSIAAGEKKDKQQQPHRDLSIEKIFYFGNKK